MGTTLDAIRVLHVDDDPAFTDLTATVLEREDSRIAVQTANSPGDGMEMLTGTDVDCIVSDYEMPRQNGIEFLEAVRGDYPDLPFILYTGKGSEEVASEAITSGVTDYLQKEVGTEQYTILANRITNAVEQYRSRREIERSEARLRKVVDALPHILYVIDEDGNYLLANEALADFHDTTVAALEGSHVEEILAEPIVERLHEDLATVFETDGLVQYPVIEIEDADGSRHVLEPRLVPFDYGDSDSRTVLGYSLDVTERERREQELHRAREEFQELFDGMNDTGWVISLEGEFLAVNEAAVDTLGYSRETLLSMQPHDIDEGLEDDEITALIENMPEDGRQVFETVHRTKEDATIPVEISSSLISYRNEPAILSIARDISTRKERERALRKERDRLDEFASIVSHDLRNPLNVAEGRLELVEEECESEHLEPVVRAHGRMTALIEELLTLAREGEAVTERESVVLTTLVEDCWANVETAGATLVVDTDLTVRADESRLKQVFENLVRNAVEHGGPDVTVTVGTRADGFYVEDDGPGVPESDRDHVFETGYSTSQEGTGFGLSIVEQVADAHGWEVCVTEGADGGARFEVTGVEFVE